MREMVQVTGRELGLKREILVCLLKIWEYVFLTGEPHAKSKF